MSDVRPHDTRFSAREYGDDAGDECPPTEPDPSTGPSSMPPRGVALSVLWWLDDERVILARR
ncbi:MAG: hypothetical protein JST00_02835 [Deltaproteobacteria bacterium]|nr:hypothetical protein [Deltaproteobacteria bacterium]